MKTFRFISAFLVTTLLTADLSAQAASTADVAAMAAQPGEDIILPALKGLRIVSDPSLLERAYSPDGNIEILGVPSLQNEDTASLIGLFIDQPVSRESMERLQVALRLLLAQHGRAFSLVYTPPQDITDGRVQVVVQESVVGDVRVEGARYFGTERYLRRLGQIPDTPVDGRALSAGVDRINQNAFRNAATRVEAGAQPGTTDIILQVNERFPWRVFGGYSNTGTPTTKEDRLNAGVSWGNAFGLGHQMTVQWSSDPDAKYSRSISANYTSDLPLGQSITLFGAYSEIESVPRGGLSQAGTNWQLGFNYELPLPDIGHRYSHRLQLGADFKSSDNNIEFALPPFIIPISDNLTHILQARVAYKGRLTDRLGATSGGIKFVASPGGLTSENKDAAFRGSRAMARASYLYGSVDVLRETNLDAVLPGWRSMLRAEFQTSSGNLLGSEQFSAGGIGSVRGYEQGEVVGDNALFFSAELVAPSLQAARRLFGTTTQDALTSYVFYDYARVWNVDKLSGERPFNLSSVGIGLRYQLTEHGSLQAAYGWQLRDSGSRETDRNAHLHLSASMSF
jgi:hemolysin activation/secretion protein